MSGPVRPYLYSNQPQRYSDPFNNDFDPKAVTRASWAPPPAPKQKQEGPLINFNRHPDSWQQAPYGATKAVPMNPNTKRNIQVARWLQLALRILNVIGAAGTIVCMAMLSNVQGIASWATRAAVKPAVDFVVALYGVGHLARGAKKKVPASAFSYHIFSILIDVAIIPFYVYIALADRWNLTQPLDNRNRWKSLIPSAADQLISYTWIIAIALGALHVVTAGLGVYLAVMFRKIANLPADLNPLEDNLTSRRKSKHKYKNSEMSEVSQQHSKHDSGISLPWEDEKRPLYFISTRNDSTGQLYSPHNPKTANESRTSLPMPAPSVADTHPSSPNAAPSIYSQPPSDCMSRASTSTKPKPPPRAGSPLKQSELSRLNSVAASSVYSSTSDGSKGSAPALPRKSSKRTSGTFESSENWSTFRDENDENSEAAFSIVPEEDEDQFDTYHNTQLRRPYQPVRNTSFVEDQPEINIHSSTRRPYQPARNSSFVEDLEGDLGNGNRYAPTPPPRSPASHMHKKVWDPTIVLQPLSMNPPTPPPQAASPLISTSGNTTPTRSPTSPGKGRYYGDLKAAVNGVRNSPQASPKANRPLSSPHLEPGVNTNEWLAPRSPKTQKQRERDQQASYEALNSRMDGQGRVLSRSGADLGDGYFEDVQSEYQDYMGMNARNVSGKVVEEGHGGRWARRRISGR